MAKHEVLENERVFYDAYCTGMDHVFVSNRRIQIGPKTVPTKGISQVDCVTETDNDYLTPLKMAGFGILVCFLACKFLAPGQFLGLVVVVGLVFIGVAMWHMGAQFFNPLMAYWLVVTTPNGKERLGRVTGRPSNNAACAEAYREATQSLDKVATAIGAAIVDAAAHP